MTDEVNQASERKQPEPSPMYEVSRRLLLAAIGAVSFAQDEVEDFIERLVVRGEMAEKEGKQLIKEVMEKRAEKRKAIEGEVNKRLHDVVERLNVPSKRDIEELSAKVAELTRKVEELNKSKE
jgi:polyhydroxyalkanoate synthesis regulator phasin